MLFMKRKKIISVKFVAKVFLEKTHVGNMKSSCMVIHQNFNVNIVAILPKPNLSSMHIIRESTNTRLTNSNVTKCTMESNVNCRFRLEPTFISKFTSYFFSLICWLFLRICRDFETDLKRKKLTICEFVNSLEER